MAAPRAGKKRTINGLLFWKEKLEKLRRIMRSRRKGYKCAVHPSLRELKLRNFRIGKKLH